MYFDKHVKYQIPRELPVINSLLLDYYNTHIHSKNGVLVKKTDKPQAF